LSTHLGSYLAAQRTSRRLTLGQLARRIGYRNLEKGSRRLQQLERDGRIVDGLLERVAAALDLNPEHIIALVEQDRRELEEAWQAWVSEPVEPQLRMRVMAAVWKREKVPTELSREGAIRYASARAVETQKGHVLMWNRGERIWCYRTGERLWRS